MYTIKGAIDKYLDLINLSRSENTYRTYGNALRSFIITLSDNGISPDNAIEQLNEDAVSLFASALKELSPATESLYLTAVAGFYKFLVAERLADVNLQRLQMLIHQRSRRQGLRLPQFPREAIDKMINYANNLASTPSQNSRERLRNLRDRAFILTLADSGLRVEEICSLRRGDVDWNEGKALVIGKGDKQAIIRFSSRSLSALKEYLTERANLDGTMGKPLTSLALFSRHDRGAGKKILPITTTTGRNIISQRVKEALGADDIGSITPHSFRHYFVTTVLRGSGGNMKLAQKLARHKSIAVTQRYAHLSDDELDQGYWKIFESNEV